MVFEVEEQCLEQSWGSRYSLHGLLHIHLFVSSSLSKINHFSGTASINWANQDVESHALPFRASEPVS